MNRDFALKTLFRVLHYTVLSLAVIVAIFPFYWVVVTSLSTSSHVFDFPPVMVPLWHFHNYVRAWDEAPWARYFFNTVFIAAVTTALVIVTSSLAGFAFGQLRFPGRGALFVLLLSLIMIPNEMLLIPNYVLLKDLNWLNTYQAQIIPYGASVFGIFLLRQFFLSLPVELYEAAAIDGCSRIRYLLKVGMPLAKGPIATIAIYIFLGSWNAFLWPLIVTTSSSVQPIQVGLATFLSAHGTAWTRLSAASVFTTAPIMVLFLILQRQFVEGVSQGAIKA